MPWSSQALISRLVIVEGAGSKPTGVFVYDPTIAAGDLIASMTDGTSSPTGDLTLPGITDYSSAGPFVNLANGTVLFGSLAAATRAAIPGSIIMGDPVTDAQRPSLAISTPQATGANKVQIILFGESKDLSAVAQMLVTAGSTTPVTTALLEVQGAITTTSLNGITASGDLVSALGNVVAQSGQVLVKTAGSGLRVKEGSNAKQGTAILVGGSVVVANTAVTASSRIFVGMATPGGTVGAHFVSSVTAGTGFTIKSTSNLDTSTVAYEIFEPA